MTQAPNIPCPHCGAEADEMCADDDEPFVGWGWHEARWELHEANRILVSIAGPKRMVVLTVDWDCPGCDHKEEVTSSGLEAAVMAVLADLAPPCKACGSQMVKHGS